MTPKQIERLQSKIADIKKALASGKRKFGGYHDGRGLRYLPTRYFVQLADYAGGLAYTKWFARNFPDDMGFPVFCLNGQSSCSNPGRSTRPVRKLFKPIAPILIFSTNSLTGLLSPLTNGKV